MEVPNKLTAFAILFWVSSIFAKPVSHFESEYTLTLLHTNDIHGRFLETSRDSLACSERDAKAGKCFGGFARLFTKIKEIRASHPNVILLSGGDYDRGTLWHTVYKWKAFAHFTNQFNYTAMALGNHDFDDDVEGAVALVEALESPVLVSNMVDKQEPSFKGKYNKSTIVEVGGRRIGMIGYITYEAPEISHTGKLRFQHEKQSIGEEARRLHDLGVDVIIALGHSGYKEDLRIAEIPHVDLVVGAHSHSFLYNGSAPDIEVPQGSYPTVVTQASGKRVLVVQAYAFTKYLGYLNVTFDKFGEIITWNGNPILLDASVPQDPQMLADLNVWNQELKEYTAVHVGQTKVFLNGKCRAGECNLGSFIADSMTRAYNKHAKMQRSAIPSKTDVHVALINSGSIRTSIGTLADNGTLQDITLADVMTLLPFRNPVTVIEIEGHRLRQALEHSVRSEEDVPFGSDGKFLQVSGLRITFNMTKPDGQRAQTVMVQGASKEYSPLDDNAVYRILANQFIADGGDGFVMLRDNVLSTKPIGQTVMEVLVEYIKERNPITQSTDGRITFAQ